MGMRRLQQSRRPTLDLSFDREQPFVLDENDRVRSRPLWSSCHRCRELVKAEVDPLADRSELDR